MKKFLSIFITLALLVSVLIIPFAVSAGSGRWVLASTNGLVYDFDSEASITSLQATAKTSTFSYDETTNAMKISTTTEGENTTIAIVRSGIDTATYPVVAALIKLDKADIATGKQVQLGFNGKDCYTPLAATTEWQLVYIKYTPDMLASAGATANNIQITLDWHRGTTNSNVGDTYFVKWIGAFASVGDMNKFAGNVERFEGANVIEFSNDNATVKTVTGTYNYSNKVNGIQFSTVKALDTFSYDSEIGAMLIDSNVSGSDHIFIVDCADLQVSVKDYPIVAYKAKWKDPIPEGVTRITNSIKANGQSKQGTYDSLLQHNVADWQIASSDFSTLLSETDLYSKIELNVTGYRTVQNYGSTQPIDVYIDWIGFFATVEDAYAYDAECAIDAIPYVINEDDTTVNAIETIYNGLTEAQQAKVANAAAIEEAKNILNAVNAISVANAEQVMNDTVKVRAANTAYTAINGSIRKARVGNWAVLEKVLWPISGAVDRINELAAFEVIDYKAIDTYNRATSAIDALTEEQLSRVGKMSIYNDVKAIFDAHKDNPVGDLNSNNNVEICDLVRVAKIVSGDDVQGVYQTPDLDGNGAIDFLDIETLRNILLNK